MGAPIQKGWRRGRGVLSLKVRTLLKKHIKKSLPF